jgi:2-polyprenyl-3-methyl-5-hydroxy-6-metoxy-1,4-benzoquinol methylase
VRPEPVAREVYDRLADAYAARAPTKPHNAFYERPATLSLLGDVAGKRVLDAGCGPGIYAEELVARGAEVVGFDASGRMVELARKRLRGGWRSAAPTWRSRSRGWRTNPSTSW